MTEHEGPSISSLWARDADLEAKIHEQEAKVGCGAARGGLSCADHGMGALQHVVRPPQRGRRLA